MDEFINATPTAELLPLSAGVQDDESEEVGYPRLDRALDGFILAIELRH